MSIKSHIGYSYAERYWPSFLKYLRITYIAHQVPQSARGIKLEYTVYDAEKYLTSILFIPQHHTHTVCKIISYTEYGFVLDQQRYRLDGKIKGRKTQWRSYYEARGGNCFLFNFLIGHDSARCLVSWNNKMIKISMLPLLKSCLATPMERRSALSMLLRSATCLNHVHTNVSLLQIIHRTRTRDRSRNRRRSSASSFLCSPSSSPSAALGFHTSPSTCIWTRMRPATRGCTSSQHTWSCSTRFSTPSYSSHPVGISEKSSWEYSLENHEPYCMFEELYTNLIVISL